MENALILFLFSFFVTSAYSQNLDRLGMDSLQIEAIPFHCVLLDEVREVKVLSKNAILMTAGKTTDLHNPVDGSYYRHNAPKFLFVPDENFEFSAKVKPAFITKYDGGALVVYSDNETWAKILLQYTEDKKSLLGISVVKNKITDDSYYDLFNSKEIYLRITKKGAVLNFFASVNGVSWILLREFLYSKPENIRIGFYTQSPIGNSCTVVFDNIIYERVLK